MVKLISHLANRRWRMRSKTHYRCFEAFDWPIRRILQIDQSKNASKYLQCHVDRT